MTPARVGRRLVAACLFILSLDAVATGTRVEAIWKPQRTLFRFDSQTTFYTCPELERRLRQVLVVLGAHEAIHIDRHKCSPDTRMNLEITFMSPVEATPENLRALSTFDTREQLVARLRGTQLSAAQDLRRFPAVWQEISLSQGRSLNLRASDCELVEQIRRQLLPRLATRDIPHRLACTDGNRSVRLPRLNVSALVASSQ